MDAYPESGLGLGVAKPSARRTRFSAYVYPNAIGRSLCVCTGPIAHRLWMTSIFFKGSSHIRSRALQQPDPITSTTPRPLLPDEALLLL